MTYRIAVVSAGLGVPSSSRLLADRLSAAVVGLLPGAEVETVELRDHGHALVDNLVTGFPAPDLAAAVGSVVSADAVIAVTPVFSGSYNGLFKMFFDVLEDGTLAGTPVLLAATAGTVRHSLALEHAVRPLFSYLRALTVPTAVFAGPEDWAGDSLAGRVDRAAAELAALLAGRPARAGRPKTPELVPFEDLLRSVSG